MGINKPQATIKCRKPRKVARQGGLDAKEAGLSELEAMMCYGVLSVLEAALQGECSACQKEFADERAVYRHLWYYAKL